MKNISYHKNLNQNAVQVYVEPPPIPLIKINNGEILDKYCVKLNCVGIRRHKSRTFMNLKCFF